MDLPGQKLIANLDQFKLKEYLKHNGAHFKIDLKEKGIKQTGIS